MKQNWNRSSGGTTILTSMIAALLGLSVFPSVCLPGPATFRLYQIITVPGTEPAKPQASIEPMQAPLSLTPALSEYNNRVVANTMDVLNPKAEPPTEGKILGRRYRSSSGMILEQKDDQIRIHSGKLEGWLKNGYLVFGQDVKLLAKGLGLFTAKVTTQTLNACEEPSTESIIVSLVAGDNYYPVLEEEDGWARIQPASDSSGYVSIQYTKTSVVPGKAVSIEAGRAVLKAAEQKQEKEQEKREEEEKSKYMVEASDDKVYLTTARVMMESGDYFYDGQPATADAIVNRVKPGRRGGSITDVIYAQGQFLGASSGLLDKYPTKEPLESVLKAVKAVPSDTDNIGDYLFFQSAEAADYGSYPSYMVVGGNCLRKE